MLRKGLVGGSRKDPVRAAAHSAIVSATGFAESNSPSQAAASLYFVLFDLIALWRPTSGGSVRLLSKL